MKSFKVMVAMAVMVVATMASAEQKQFSGSKANVPFDFAVGNQVLPAGEYHVTVLGSALVLTNEDGQSVTALSHGVETFAPAERSELVFSNQGGTRQLYRFWRAGYGTGLELSLTKNAAQTITQQNSGSTHIAIGK